MQFAVALLLVHSQCTQNVSPCDLLKEWEIVDKLSVSQQLGSACMFYKYDDLLIQINFGD